MLVISIIVIITVITVGIVIVSIIARIISIISILIITINATIIRRHGGSDRLCEVGQVLDDCVGERSSQRTKKG